MAIGLTRSKNLSESNLNLKTALQKLYAPGIENDIELYSLSSSVESICFSGDQNDETVQIFGITPERLNTLTGGVIQRTKFNTRYLTFSDGNKVYFTKYLAGVGGSAEAGAPRYSVSGSVPSIQLVSGGAGFYFLNAQNQVAQLENFSGTWTSSGSEFITVTVASHGFLEGQGLYMRFNNSGGGDNAIIGDYTVESVTDQNTFTVRSIGGSITGSGDVLVSSSDIRLNNVLLRGKISGRSSLRANVTFGKIGFEYLLGKSATYSNTSSGTELGSTASIHVTLPGHTLVIGDYVYIRAISGTLISGFARVSYVDSDTPNEFEVVLPVGTANTAQNCEVCLVDELVRFTSGNGSRYFVKSIEIADPGSGYVIPEELEVVEGVSNNANTGQPINILKQRGELFEGAPEIIRTKVFTYTVRNASSDGFFLYDEEKQKYLFTDKDNEQLSPSQAIELRRFDGVTVDNILQFKFAQSPLYLRSYSGDVFSLGSSAAAAISSLGNAAGELKYRSRLAIQNTRRPTPVTSAENILGYAYNSFAGQDVVLWQRVVVRDQDFVLDPNDNTLGVGSVTGDRLKTAVSEFVMGPLVPWASTSTGVVTISLADHSVETGDSVRVTNISASSGVIFQQGTYTATKVNSSSFTISADFSIASAGTLNLVVPDPAFQIRTPGLFIKVGNDYRRAFSTTDKPFFQDVVDAAGVGAFANPKVSGSGASFTNQALGALSAEGTLVGTNPSSTDWYSYSTTISELAQRIHTNGRDGAFYFHRQTAPTITNIQVNKNGVATNIYAVPLFTLA